MRVTLVDRRNHHLFQPLLYQVATATLNPSDIASPIRSMLRSRRNVSVVLGEAISVHVGAKRVILADGAIAYDYLIVSTGARDKAGMSAFDVPDDPAQLTNQVERALPALVRLARQTRGHQVVERLRNP